MKNDYYSAFPHSTHKSLLFVIDWKINGNSNLEERKVIKKKVEKKIQSTTRPSQLLIAETRE